jgi:DNA polymerase
MFAKAGLPFAAITQTRGEFFKTNLLGLSVAVFPTFHPAAALYNGKHKKQLIEDFRALGHELAGRHLVRL